MKAARWLALLLAILAAGGCGRTGTPDYQVSGRVTWNGSPVEKGDIIFVPRDRRNRAAASKITQGRFTLRTGAGPNQVQIYASRDSDRIDPAMHVPVLESLIPPEFNIQSTLEADVSPRDDNELNFDLKPRSP